MDQFSPESLHCTLSLAISPKAPRRAQNPTHYNLFWNIDNKDVSFSLVYFLPKVWLSLIGYYVAPQGQATEV